MKDIGSDSKKVIDIDQLDLQKIQRSILAEHEVNHHCELRDFVESELKLEFKRGCAFYEFVHNFEDISEDKQLVFKDKVSNFLLLFYHILMWLTNFAGSLSVVLSQS